VSNATKRLKGSSGRTICYLAIQNVRQKMCASTAIQVYRVQKGRVLRRAVPSSGEHDRNTSICLLTHSTQGWPSHQVYCTSVSRIDLLKQRWPARRAQRRYPLVDGEDIMSPYENGVLTESLQEDVIDIRRGVRRWLALSETWQEGAEDEIIQATVELASL
jgi:hypothetical protein